MIVVDASAIVEFLLGTPVGRRVAAILEAADDIQSPALLDVEVAQVVRRLVLGGTMSPAHGGAVLEILQSMPVERRPMDALLPRIWQLRENLTAYDAAYVALGEALECPLLTLDERITSAPGLRVEVRVP